MDRVDPRTPSPNPSEMRSDGIFLWCEAPKRKCAKTPRELLTSSWVFHAKNHWSIWICFAYIEGIWFHVAKVHLSLFPLEQIPSVVELFNRQTGADGEEVLLK